MSLLDSVFVFSFKPSIYALPIFAQAKIAKINPNIKDPSYFDSFKARMLCIAQVIMSIIALPVILIVGLLSAAVNAALNNDNNDITTMWLALKTHVILHIPVAAVGVFAPLTTTVDVAASQFECLG